MLERAYAERDPRLVFLKDCAVSTTLRQEPRFIALKKSLRLDR